MDIATFAVQTLAELPTLPDGTAQVAENILSLVNSALGITVSVHELAGSESARTRLAREIRGTFPDQPDFEENLTRLVQRDTELAEKYANYNRVEQQVSGDNNTTAGRDMITHTDNSRNEVGTKHGVKPIYVVVMVLGGIVFLVFLFMFVIPGIKNLGSMLSNSITSVVGPTLTKDSTCREYLAQDDATRKEAVYRIGVELGNAHATNPMSWFSVDASCGGQPNTTLGEMLAPEHWN